MDEASAVEELRAKLRDVEETNDHLRERLFALQAKRVQMQGYLFKFRSYPVGLFNDPWEMRYFSLVDSCLKCYLSEQTTALIPETELHVHGYSLHWEGIKKKKYWAFGFKDENGCAVLRLSSADRPTAWKWMSALEAAAGGGAATKTTSSSLVRMQSMPLTQTSISDSKEGTPNVREYPDVVAATEDAKAPRRRSNMVGSTAVHTLTRASVLSSERILQHPHPGILNLGIVIIVAANFRLVLENVFKYGLRVNPLRWFERLLWGSSQPLMLCWPVLAASIGAAYLIEKFAIAIDRRREAAQKKTDTAMEESSRIEPAIVALHVVNVVLCFLVPLWLVYLSENAVLPSFVLTLVTLVVCMKIVSYAHCNADLRRARSQDRDLHDDPIAAVSYPANLTTSNLVYFICAPTLTYQISFPRSERIRGKWLLRRCGELIVALSLQLTIIDQYIVPAVENSMRPLGNREFIALIERVLKLSLPVLYAWLIMFYIVFHLWLNILAEAMRFGDREFYLDWWNALNLGDYWKTWNIPVHRWMLRTVYYPAIHFGLERSTAMLLVFFISALLHEVAVIVPLKFSSSFPWAFVGMLLQVPLIFFSQFLQKKFGDRWGNIIFWVSFCVVGQPICLLNYYYDWIHVSHASA